MHEAYLIAITAMGSNTCIGPLRRIESIVKLPMIASAHGATIVLRMVPMPSHGWHFQDLLNAQQTEDIMNKHA